MIRRLFLGCWLLLMLACAVLPARAAEGIELVDASLEATDDGYLLSSSYSVELSRSLEDALMRGVPLYFTLQTEVTRARWYWFDEVAIRGERKIRLSYNVLTRQYRASVDGNLQRSFARLDDMLSLLRRPGRWLIGEPGALKPNATYTVSVQLALDVSALPKPIQVSAMASGEWHVSSGWHRFSYRTDSR